MRFILCLVGVIFLQTSVQANEDVRCLAKLKVEDSTQLENADGKWIFKYEVISIPKGYWQNSCELDFTFAMEDGIYSGSEISIQIFDSQIIYVVGIYSNHGQDYKSKFKFYRNVDEHELLQSANWSK